MSDYTDYVSKYSYINRVTEEEAEKHKMVKIVKDMYESREKNSLSNEGGKETYEHY